MDLNHVLPDAYSQPQAVRPGCQHQLGCKCTPPYWLRASTAMEESRERWIRREFDSDAIPDCPRCAAAHWPQCPEKAGG